jgi:hypothetical protein
MVAQKGVQAQGLATGLRISRFLRYASVGSNALIHASLAGTGVNSSNDGVLLLGTPPVVPAGSFQLRILLREGDIAADTGGQKIGSILQLDTDNISQKSSVITSLTKAPTNANLALWTVRPFPDGAAVRQRMRKGNFQSTAGGAALLTSI